MRRRTGFDRATGRLDRRRLDGPVSLQCWAKNFELRDAGVPAHVGPLRHPDGARKGVCSAYLADAPAGLDVPVTVQPSPLGMTTRPQS
ncbi:hypothetical protein Atai01_13870 [Amycolatopsis taiwanensis]|uniref:Uncharacterized protein n=1 Tax=Amycolatopsis taiwanensis TaxID=342230 RepID=A0A9W6QYB3_9PSEU|nr:hypothetical protein Atai01_13870 [Amycolatopsis taiwanensis]